MAVIFNSFVIYILCCSIILIMHVMDQLLRFTITNSEIILKNVIPNTDFLRRRNSEYWLPTKM